MDKKIKQGDAPVSLKAKFESLNPIIDRKKISTYSFDTIDTTQYQNISTRDTSGRWVRLSVSATRYGTTNKFAISCSFWCSSSQVYNGFGQRVKFSGSNISGLPSTYSTTISSGVWGVSSKSFDVTISASTTLTVSTICSWCDDGLTSADHPYNYERTNFTNSDSVSLTYITQEVIPNDPKIVINAPEGYDGRADYTEMTLNGNGISGYFRCYPAQTSSGSGKGNTLQFYIGMPSGGKWSRIIVEKFTNGSGWASSYDTGWKELLYHKVHLTYYSDSRYDKGIAWRVKSMVKSSTNYEKSSNYIYYVINDQPVFSNNQPNISCESIIPYGGNVNVRWDSASNSIFQSVYKLRYKQTTASSWNVVDVGTTSKTISLASYGRGAQIEFQVLAQDMYDADTEYRGSAIVKINQLPTANSSSISSNKDSSPYNARYVNNVQFTLPGISDADGQGTSYQLEYKVGSGNWITYSSSHGSGNFTLNCANYQNTRGGTLQLRARPYDGMEYGNYIYSKVLYKNQLPSANSSSISSNKDSYPYNGCYVNNVQFTLPGISDSDGHSTSYQLEYKIGSGSWTVYSSSHGTGNFTLNCSNYQNTRGGTFQLRAKPYDGMEYGNYIYSAVLYRNKLPAAPVLTIDYGKKYLSEASDVPHNGHVEKIYQIKWNNVNNYCNNEKIANSNFKVKFYGSNNNLLKTITGQDIGSMGGIPYVTDNHYLNSITRNSEFKIIVEVTDILGESNSTTVGPYKRNNTPTKPTNFNVGFTNSIDTVSNRKVTFNKSTDVDNDSLYYHLQIKRYNSSNWVDFSNNYTTTQSVVTWNIVDSSSHYGDVYRLRAIDEHGATSDWISLEDTSVSGASIVHPISPTIVYNKKPRILFKLKPNSLLRYINVIITVNGNSYSNLVNSQYFSLPIYREDAKGVFRCPINLNVGNNTITISTFIGNTKSSVQTFTVVYNNSLENQIQKDAFLTMSRINNIQTMVNNYYSAYGCIFSKRDMSKMVEPTVSTVNIYNNIFNNIIDINKTINDYDKEFCSNNKLTVTIPNNVVNNTTYHLISQINDILSILTERI